MNAKEFANLAQHAVEWTGFIARRRLDGIAVHWITGPCHVCALFLNSADQAWQVVTNGASAETCDQGQTTRFVGRVQRVDQRFEVTRCHRRTTLETDRVLDAFAEFDMRAVWLTCAVTDPDHVTRASNRFASSRIDPAQRFFVFQQQRFVAGEEINGFKRVRRFAADSCRFHKVERISDAVGHRTVFFRFWSRGKA